MFQNRNGYTNNWLPSGSVVKNSPANIGDAGYTGSFPGSRRSPGGGNGNRLQCLENPMDRRAWWATVHGVAKSWTFAQLDTTEQVCTTQIIAELKTEVSV